MQPNIDPEYLHSQGLSKDIYERFRVKFVIIPETDCWEWQNAIRRFRCHKSHTGHGQICRGGIYKPRLIYAHILSWILFRYPVPPGKQVQHCCPCGSNPLCVNPEHLQLGNAKDNADYMSKERHNRLQTHPEESQFARLTWEDVRFIRTEYAAGNYSQWELARMFNTDQAHIWRIIHHKMWKE